MKSVLVLVSVLLLAILLVLFWPSSSDELDKAIEASAVTPAASENDDLLLKSQGLNKPASDELVEKMKLVYDSLEADRKTLNKQLNRMKHEIWGVELPAEEARTINTALMAGFKYLKFPKKLGAFSNVEGIQSEKAKVDFLLKDLDAAKQLLEQHEQSKDAQTDT